MAGEGMKSIAAVVLVVTRTNFFHECSIILNVNIQYMNETYNVAVKMFALVNCCDLKRMKYFGTC